MLIAVKVTKAGATIGHVPEKISSACSLLISNGGVISCEGTNPNRKSSRDVPQGGLEIPRTCMLKFQGNEQLINKAKKLLAISKKCIVKEGTTEKVDLPLPSYYPKVE